jgi:hypothetical protein
MAPTATPHRAGDGTCRSRARFWLRRYLVAEIASVAGLLLCARLAAAWSWPAPMLAVLATIVSGIGFYGVLALGVHAEQRRAGAARPRRRTLVLLIAEFGPAELLDSLLVRPTAIWLALAVISTDGAAVIVGKVAADVVFYAAAAAAFAITVRTGVRDPAPGVGSAEPIQPPLAAGSAVAGRPANGQ